MQYMQAKALTIIQVELKISFLNEIVLDKVIKEIQRHVFLLLFMSGLGNAGN